MKESAVITTVARGPIIDSDALAEALRSGAIGGAGLVRTPAQTPPVVRSHCVATLTLRPALGRTSRTPSRSPRATPSGKPRTRSSRRTPRATRRTRRAGTRSW